MLAANLFILNLYLTTAGVWTSHVILVSILTTQRGNAEHLIGDSTSLLDTSPFFKFYPFLRFIEQGTWLEESEGNVLESFSTEADFSATLHGEEKPSEFSELGIHPGSEAKSGETFFETNLVNEEDRQTLLELTTDNFDKHIDGHRQVMLLFCSPLDEIVCQPVKNEFEQLAKMVEVNAHLHFRSVVAHIDSKDALEIVRRFRIKGHPSVRYLGWGKDLSYLGVLTLNPNKSAHELYDFLLDHVEDELYIFRTRVMDKFAYEFMLAFSEQGRAKVFEATKKSARSLVSDREKESARLYLLIMRDSNMNNWYRLREMEREFQSLRSLVEMTEIYEDKRWELEKRLSVMSAFVLSVQSERKRKDHRRVEKHIFGRHVDGEL
mmetsp:Transcript_33554/g.46474  ORF Transcript_33554/g.46474 Transcript_33554/m.46474 type:complete len:379 (+) Transcript_33554:406-1542(+)|eukprot:CAMPEP_0196589382 /NCGR_PEP_ID=MMETSP1081-20130531/63389_1 /TAXON_ID=36882 /ORGANISM="Pyramimonas amylifera, Strain CCMP720" /LENGTH=378 /DNA_ID=CAMNT_0041912163 /DNA_START=404 /DNA_END=1540 /DNA_ORIENTATION=-